MYLVILSKVSLVVFVVCIPSSLLADPISRYLSSRETDYDEMIGAAEWPSWPFVVRVNSLIRMRPDTLYLCS